MKKKKSLQTKAFHSMIIFSAALIVFICAGVGVSYYFQVMDNYRQIMFGYTRTAAELLNGDKVEQYLNTKEKDEYYEAVQSRLQNIQSVTQQEVLGAEGDEQTDANVRYIDYFYVYGKSGDKLIYIWNTDEQSDVTLGDEKEPDETEQMIIEREYKKNPEQKIVIEKNEERDYTAVAHSPVFNTSGEVVALVGARMEIQGIEALVTRYLPIVIGTVMLVIAIAAFLMYRTIRKRVIHPINTLNSEAGQMAQHIEQRKQSEIVIRTGDEIEELSLAFNKMNADILEYMRRWEEESKKKQQIQADLNAAKAIQEGALPTNFTAVSDKNGFDIYASMTPAKEVGGDFYDFFFIDDNHLAFEIADVSGKGVPAAMFMMLTKILISERAAEGGTPAEILEAVNRRLCKENDADMFVTVWLGILDVSTGRVTAVNAGHENPALCRAGQEFVLLEQAHGFVLSGMEGIRYRNVEIQLEKGDKLFLYTDGVAEATRKDFQMFGTQRLIEYLNKNTDKTPQMLLDTIKREVLAFTGDNEQFDDITMLCIEYKGEQECTADSSK